MAVKKKTLVLEGAREAKNLRRDLKARQSRETCDSDE